MRVLFIIRATADSHYGGDIVQLKNTAKWMSKLGVECKVTSNPHEIATFRPNVIHFSCINLQLHMNSIVEVAASLEYKPLLACSTIYVNYSDFESRVRKSIYIKLFMKIFGYKKLEFLKECARGKTKFIRDFFRHIFFHDENYYYNKTIPKIDLFLPNSQAEKDALIKDFGISPGKIHVVTNGFDTTYFSSFNNNDKTSLIPFENYILCVARIEKLKNQANLIKACKICNKNLILIGQLPKSQKLYYLKEIFPLLDEKRIYIGPISHAKLVPYYRNCTIHALPSFFETCGLSTIEALACNRKVIVSDVGYVRSCFGAPDCVFYCDPYSVDSIANAIRHADAATPEQKSFKHIVNSFTWENAAKQTYQAYHATLQAKK